MKKLFTISLLTLHIIAVGQTGAFKRIISEKSTVDRETFYDQLTQFQKENVEFGNVYYQLGKVEMDLFSSLDPIVDRIAARQRVYNAKTNFGLATNYLDESEISKFPEWYDVPESTSKDSISLKGKNKIDKSYSDAVEYAVSYEELVENYDRAVYHYLKAREGFIDINTSADNLRQLFLKADDSLKMRVKAVGVSFDSSMYHTGIYREIYQKLPHKKKRKVNVTKKKIDHFRMNGITSANFLADEIDVWDYREWSDRFLALLKVEVDGLQDEIKAAYKFFMATNDKMINGEDCIQANLDELKFQRIINLVTKYDNESVLIDIFQYLTAKLDYGNKLVYERVCNALDEPPTDDFLSRKARIYQNIYGSFAEADSLNETIISSGHNQATFQWFFNEMMPGENGSKTFAEEQAEENRQSFKRELQGLQASMSQQRFDTDSISKCFEMDSILVLAGQDGANFCASKSLRLQDDLDVLLGLKDGKNLLVGGSPLEDDYEKVWEFEPRSEVSFFKVVGDSSFIIGGNKGKFWITQLDFSGQEYYTATLKSGDPVIDVIVNPLQGVTTVLQKGSSGYNLSQINFNGKQESSKSIGISKEIFGMTTLEQERWFFTHDQTSEGSQIIAFVYDESSGDLARELTYNFTAELKDPKVIKNDNEFLTILSTSAFADDEIVYALINYNGEVKHEKVF